MGTSAVHTQHLPAPDDLMRELPLTLTANDTVLTGRTAARRVLAGTDDRVLVVVGPCSIHDADAGLAYAKALRETIDELRRELLIIMRVYVEKPRTGPGWPGLLGDPGLDGTLDVARGLRLARTLILEITELGLTVATEWLSPVVPAYLADLVSWGAIGARTVESQVHRQLASGLPMPIGMKNSGAGSITAAVNAVDAASAPHAYLGTAPDGTLAVVRTSGNPDCQVVLRGSPDQSNYRCEQVHETVQQLAAAQLPTGIVIDASHGNSGKDPERQAVVSREIAAQIAAGSTSIRGVMLESFLAGGRQDLDGSTLMFGQSITDACMSWDVTVEVLRELAAAVRRGRAG